jgi:hypothetical protein
VTSNTLAPQKSLWSRIAGPQAFNPYSLIVVSTVATIGTLSIYTSYDAENFFVTLTILGIVQFVALLPLVVIAPLVRSITQLSCRLAAVIGSYVLVNVIRSLLLDTLLINWGIETESRLAFRLYSNVIFLSILMTAFAWGADLVSDDLMQVSTDEESINSNKQKLSIVTSEIDQARTYVSRELSLEISATQTELADYESRANLDDGQRRSIGEFRLLLDQVSAKLSTLAKLGSGVRSAAEVNIPQRYSLRKVVDASTYVSPYVPSLMGGLSFVALAGWLGYFVDRLTALRWAAYLGAYSFVIYWLYRRFLLPWMRKRSTYVRLAIFEISLAPFVFFWLALLGYLAGDDSETYGIAGANSISVFIFANIATFVSGVLASASEYREALESSSKLLGDEIAELQATKIREENIWKEFFAGDISNSPTTATVRIREAVAERDGPGFSQVQSSVIQIWQNVLHYLEQV